MIRYKGMLTLEVLEGADNYNKWIAESLLPYAKSPILEIGAGIGNISTFFLKGSPFVVTDVDAGLVTYLKAKLKRHKKVIVERMDITKRPHKKYLSYFSTIFAVNVLEHIKDDVLALNNMQNMLSKEGRLLLLVPAKKFATTSLDKELGHFRRYEKEQVIRKIAEAGLTVEKLYYFNILGLLSWLVRDKIDGKNTHLKPHHIAIFDKIVPILRVIESLVKPPIGISFIVVAKKSI